MWIYLNNAFLSIVKDRGNTGNLSVRARVKGDLEAVFPGASVNHAPEADYAYRTSLASVIVENAISECIRFIDYDNFKASVKHRDRHDAYLRCWLAMQDFQRLRAPRKKNKPRAYPLPAASRLTPINSAVPEDFDDQPDWPVIARR